jgi:hypothetical protein
MLLIGTIPAVWLMTSLAVLVLVPARCGGRWMAGQGVSPCATQKLSIDGAVG